MKRLLILLALALAPLPILAQGPPDSATIVNVAASAKSVAAGRKTVATIVLGVKPGWHVNSNHPSADYLKPTLVTLTGGHGVTVGKAVYPAARTIKLQYSAEPLSVFEGRVVVTVPVTVASSVKAAKVTLKGEVAFQPCNATSCFAPATKPFTLSLSIKPKVVQVVPPVAPVKPAPAPSVVQAPHPATAKAVKPPAPVPAVQRPVTPVAATAIPPARDRLSDALETHGLLALLGILFVAGLLLNLTPCVYPMIAVTMSIFGARAGDARSKVLGKAAVYVLGMATMYTTLGVVAALTGGLFGGLLQSTLVKLFIAAFLVILALGMFGAYTLQLPPALANRLGGTNRIGVVGLFFSGLVVGLFAAPCTGPVVLSLLVLVGARHSVGFGALTFFALALGLGAPYIVLGSSTGLLGKLPRSGGWMETVKHVFGVILIAVAAQYFVLALAPAYGDIVVPATMVAGAFYLAFLDANHGESARFRLNKRVVALVVAAVGVYAGVGSWGAMKDREARWSQYSDAAFAAARAEGKPIVMDFGASWCAECKQLDHATLRDPKVVNALKPFARLRVDMDGANQAQAPDLGRRWGVKGLPDVVFVDSTGVEVPEARVKGFVPPDRFLQVISLARRTQRNVAEVR